jgi:(2Fe-2S) ferredoxin
MTSQSIEDLRCRLLPDLRSNLISSLNRTIVPSDPTMLICQDFSCRKQAAAKVLTGFKNTELTGVTIEGCRYLGRCGSGPNILVLPDRTCYDRVRPEDLGSILDRELGDSPPSSPHL